jgi:phage terminase large subunit-like protein
MAAHRHLDDLARIDSRWHFDSKKVEKVCIFIESLTLDSGNPFRLQDFQVWIVANLMGWVDDAGLRKYIEALIIISKGNGKSPLAGALALWFAFFDGKRKSEVYCGATSLNQALEIHKYARDFVDAQKAFARMGVTAQKMSIYSTKGDVFKPVIGRGKHGPKPYLAILDELHQAISPDLYDTLRTGCNKVVNSLLLTVSTAGDLVENNPCYQLQQQAQKALDGSLPNDRLFAALYVADDSVEWTSPEALRMSNPNLGISNDAEKIRLAQEEATRNPAKQGTFKAMHLGIWTNTTSQWMNMQAWNKCADSSLTPESLADAPCWLGIDTSSKLDLSSIVKLFRRDIDGKTHYYAFAHNYLPETQVNLPENQHYQRWAIEGWLTPTDGSAIDFAKLEEDALEDIRSHNVEAVCFDPAHGGLGLVQRLVEATNVTQVETPQRVVVISPAMKELEACIADGRFHFDGDPVMTWCASNIQTKETANGLYRMPDKDQPENKIDTAMALLFALSQAMVSPVKDTSTWAFEPFII